MTQAVTKYLKWTPAEIMLAILFLLAPLYYHPNIGGEGLRIPHNVVIWFIALIFIGVTFRQVLQNKTISLPRAFLLIAAFPVLATISGFIAGVEQPLKWAFRMLFIWGGLLFFIAVLQQQLCDKREKQLLYLIVLFGFIHVFIGVCQFYFRDSLPFLKSPSGSPYGLFQQVNNHATYLVTLIIIATYLLTTSFVGKSFLKISLLLIFILTASFVVGLSSSRVGALTLFISLIILLIGRFVGNNYPPKKSIILLVILSICIGFSSGNINKGSSLVDKVTALNSGYSGEARISIYSLTTELALEKPIFGYGIGSFSREFQGAKADFYKKRPDAKFGQGLISHPHNELFLWALEGGLVAVAGIFFSAIGILLTFWTLGISRGMTFFALLTPIALHLQVELPFYISAIHWFLFLLIIAISCRGVLEERRFNLSSAMLFTTKFSGAIVVSIGAIFLLQTMYANQQLIAYRDVSRHFEKNYLYQAQINPYLSEVAQELDMRVLYYSAMEMNDVSFLKYYVDWAELSIHHEPKPYLLQNLASAYFKLGDVDNGCRVLLFATETFPKNQVIGDYPFFCQ